MAAARRPFFSGGDFRTLPVRHHPHPTEARMHTSLDEQWNLGRQAEAAGDMALAERHYAALLARNDRHIPALLRMSRFAQAKNRYRAARQLALQAADAARLERSTRHLAFVTRR